MRGLLLLILAVLAAGVTPARATLRITRDHGGYVEEYKAKYERIRAKGERVVTGSVTTAALITTAETLLDNRGGYLSNDRLPPGVFLPAPQP